jgi:hypothetical protein
MNPAFKKRSGAQITHAFWRSNEKLTRMMCSGAGHVLATKDGKLLVICSAKLDERKVVFSRDPVKTIRENRRFSRKVIGISEKTEDRNLV